MYKMKLVNEILLRCHQPATDGEVIPVKFVLAPTRRVTPQPRKFTSGVHSFVTSILYMCPENVLPSRAIHHVIRTSKSAAME